MKRKQILHLLFQTNFGINKFMDVQEEIVKVEEVVVSI